MLGHRVAFGAALLTALQLVIKFVDVISLVIMARLLTPADFGLVALAASVLAIVGAVTELNVSDVLVQRKEIDPRDIDTAFTLNLLRGFLVMALVLGVAGPMTVVYDDTRLLPILATMSLFPLIGGLSSPAIVYFQHRLEYGPDARLRIVGRLGGLVISIWLAFVTRSYWALIAGQLTTQLISTVYSYHVAPYRPRLRLEGTRSILNFAGWVTASRIISTANLQSDKFFIAHILGKATLGQYTVGGDMSSIATYAFAGPIMQTMFGGFSRIQGDLARMRAAYLKGQQMLVSVLLPLGFGLAIIADRFIPLVIGPNWDGAILAIIWLSPVVSLQVLYLPMLSLSMAMGQPRVLVVRETVNLVMRLPLTIAGAWYFGLIGAIIARSLSSLGVVFMTLIIANRFINASVLQQLVNIWRSIVSVIVMLVGVALLKYMIPASPEIIIQFFEVALFIFSGAVLYAGTHAGLWFLVGRPDGAEQFMFHMAKKILKISN